MRRYGNGSIVIYSARPVAGSYARRMLRRSAALVMLPLVLLAAGVLLPLYAVVSLLAWITDHPKVVRRSGVQGLIITEEAAAERMHILIRSPRA